MAEWLSIIGIGEDGVEGLGKSSLAALDAAEVVFGAPRHLAMVAHPDRRDWPVPFSIAPVLGLRGRKVAVLASGDPFWHGAGGTLAAALAPGEWRAYPAVSCLSLAAARLGWRLEEVAALGLHAAPVTRLRPHLAPGAQAIVTLRDGAAVAELAGWLAAEGFGETRVTVMERLGGPAERLREATAAGFALEEIGPLVTVALEIAGAGRVIPRASGLPDEMFGHDGQITKRPVRALALSALAPRPGETLWDLGAGSGSVSVEWCLAAPATRAQAVEARPDRAANIRRNGEAFGLSHRLSVIEGRWHQAVRDLPAPDAVFLGGGADSAGIETIWHLIPPGARLVVNAVTLESETLLALCHEKRGGTLLRIELAAAEPLGGYRGWRPARPVVQWSVVR